MNPLTNMKNVKKLSEQELTNLSKSSWHDMYRDSAWIFIGGLPYELTEGDVICIFSQYGEVVNINLVRDKATGKQKGFCFICYEDQRSTVLAVDNFNGIKILGRTIRVDHVLDYKMPKEFENITEEMLQLRETGCAFPVKIKKEKKSPERTLTTTDTQLPDIKPKKEKIKKEKLKKVKKEKTKKKSKKSTKGKKEKKKKNSDKSKKKHKKRKKVSSESESEESSSASSSSSSESSSDSD